MHVLDDSQVSCTETKPYKAMKAKRKILGVCLGMAALLISCDQKPAHVCIRPLPTVETADLQKDTEVAVAFKTSDINWRGGNLKVTFFGEQRYDSAQVASMSVGDTLVYDGKKMVVNKVEWERGFVIVNGDIENGGACLSPTHDGCYLATQMDDHPAFVRKGTAEVYLAQDVVMIQCGTNPDDPYDTIRSGVKAYLDTLPDYMQEFSPANTSLKIENGEVKTIQRKWIP